MDIANHTEIMIQLGVQTATLRDINAHLITLNSKVATQEARIGKMEMDNAFRAGERGGAKTAIIAIWAVLSALGGAIGTTLISHYWVHS